MKVKGIVVKIKDSHCLVLASDGTYHKVPRSRHKGARVGSEIEFALNNWNSYVKPALLVASILAVALGISLFQQAAIPPAFAYVSLDINPSVELEVGPDLKVISAHPLNKDAKNLLDHVKVSGKQIYASVNSILAEAAQEGFLKPGQKNYVVSTVTLEKASSKNIDYEALTGEMRSAVQDKGVEVELLVLSTDSKLRKEAKSKGLSTGKLVIYRQAVEAGESVSLEQVKETSITNLVNNYKINIIPLDKKNIIKSLEIKPLDKSQDRDQNFENSSAPGNDGTDNELQKDNPNQSQNNPKDDKQVSTPTQMGRDDSENGRQSSEQKKDNKKDNGNNNRDKDSKVPDSGHLTERGNGRGNDSGGSNGNSNSRGKADDNKYTGERDDKSDSDKRASGDKQNTQEGDKDSSGKHNSQEGDKDSGDTHNTQKGDKDSGNKHNTQKGDKNSGDKHVSR